MRYRTGFSEQGKARLTKFYCGWHKSFEDVDMEYCFRADFKTACESHDGMGHVEIAGPHTTDGLPATLELDEQDFEWEEDGDE